MPVLTRKAVFLAVKAKFPLAKQRTALSQKLGKKWSYASTDALAQAVGLQGTPRKSAAKGTDRAKATAKQHGFARSFASENAAKNLSDNETKRALIKGRLVRSVKHAMTAKAKAIGRKLTPQEKKIVAAKAFSREVKAIKAGQPESKPKRGGNQKPSALHTPPPGVSVADHKAALRRQYGASSGSRSEQLSNQESRRADVGNGMNGSSDRVRDVADRVSESKVKKVIPSKKADHQMTAEEYAVAHPNLNTKERDHSHSQAIAHAIRSGLSVRGEVARPYYDFPAVEAAYIEKDRKREAEAIQLMTTKREPKPLPKWAGHRDPVSLDKPKESPDREPKPKKKQSVDDIPFGKTSETSKPSAKRLDGKLNSEQKTTIAAHLRKIGSGAASSVPLRALQDSSGQHWLEMKSASGKVGAVPIDAHGKKDNDRAVHSDEWKAKAEGMKTISRFPAGKKAVAESAPTLGKFAGDFEKAYFAERKKQELRGVVAIHDHQVFDRLKAKGYSPLAIEQGFDAIKHKMFVVKEKGSRALDLEPGLLDEFKKKRQEIGVSPADKAFHLHEFAADFEKEYFEERRKQELRGGVAIYAQQVFDRLKAKGYSQEHINEGYKAIKQSIYRVDDRSGEMLEMEEGLLDKFKQKPKTPTVTTGTRNTMPWAGEKAPLQGRKRAEMVRGRSID